MAACSLYNFYENIDKYKCRRLFDKAVNINLHFNNLFMAMQNILMIIDKHNKSMMVSDTTTRLTSKSRF
jgi:hypothetical protein